MSATERHEARLPKGPPPTLLTPRERETALLVGKGLSNIAIGETLGCATKTADIYVQRCKEKLGCTNRIELARAVWEGLVV